jgi:hypothetical protein
MMPPLWECTQPSPKHQGGAGNHICMISRSYQYKLFTLMVSNTREGCYMFLKLIKNITSADTPTQSSKFWSTKGLAAPQEAMYIHFESPAHAVADFHCLPWLSIIPMLLNKGVGNFEVSPSHQNTSPRQHYFKNTHPLLGLLPPNY